MYNASARAISVPRKRPSAHAFSPCDARLHRLLGINPGTPVSTTLLNRIFVATPSRISCMASSGRVDSSSSPGCGWA